MLCRNDVKTNTELSKLMSNEPPHDKTNKMACAPGEDSDKPGPSPSLIRAFAVRSMDSTQALFMRTAKTLIRLGVCPG